MDYIIQNPEIEAVVDLGSGTGQRLIKLFYMGCPRHIRLYAAEQSETARAFNQRLVDLDAGLDISIHDFDIRQPDFSFVREKKNVLFFTAYSIMLIHEIGRDPFESMVKAADAVTGVHFEPLGFQFSEPLGFQFSMPTYEFSDRQAQHAYSRKWNVDMGRVLQDYHDTGSIRIEYLGKDIFPSDDPSHVLSVVLWQKASESG